MRPSPQVLWFTTPIVLLGLAASIAGILLPSTYAKETVSFATQGVGQDWVNLLIAFPLMAIAAVLSARGSLRAYLVWVGTLMYVVYSYVIYAFFVHFGPMFLVYVAILGIAVYALIWALVTVPYGQIGPAFAGAIPRKSVSIFLLVFCGLFYLLWLSEIIPALVQGTVPASIREVNLPSGPIYVLDLSLMLPAVGLSAVFLWRRFPVGYVLAGAILLQGALLGAAVMAMTAVMRARGITPASGPVVAIGAFMIISTTFLISYLRGIRS